MNAAIFSGAFDPFTLGHYDIVVKAGLIFDKVYIAVAEDTGKAGVSKLSDRVKIAKTSVDLLNFAEVISFSGALSDFASALKVNHIIRGIRNTSDFNYEKDLLAVYKSQNIFIEGIYFMPQPSRAHISSSTVRELVKIGGRIDDYVCDAAIPAIVKLYAKDA